MSSSPAQCAPAALHRVPTSPLSGQRTGTSGLRKKTRDFMAPHYLPNWVQALFNALELDPARSLRGYTLVLGGDGRYFNEEAAQVILKMAAANGVRRVVIGQGGLLATPAVSNLIRRIAAAGGIIMTASHNPGGPDNDWGIKYNTSNGAPAPESLTDVIYERTLDISEYLIADIPDVDLSVVAEHHFGDSFSVEVIDSTAAYLDMCREVFDFDLIRGFVTRRDFTMVADAMHGVASVYMRDILMGEFGLPASCLLHAESRADFGGLHPDPNLTYAKELVDLMLCEDGPVFGIAADGDADRNMILGRNCFVCPSDSVAIIAEHAPKCIPAFDGGLPGVARSMPTSSALDRVAKAANIPVYEVPTGWKFFCNLMDDGRISICGEESFGTGCNVTREKDFGFAMLSWLSILASHNKDVPLGGQLVQVADIVRSHFARFGRSYYVRYDFEECDAANANSMMSALDEFSKDTSSIVGAKFGQYTVEDVVQFRYQDPVDGSVAEKQGIIIHFEGGSRVIFRLSGTGSVGATIRMYLEKYEGPDGLLEENPQEYTRELADSALELSKLREFTGREEPSVIT